MRLRDIIPKVNLLLKINKIKPDILVVDIGGNGIGRRPILDLMREYNFLVFVHQHITQKHLAPDGLHITRKEITFLSTHTRQTLVKPY